MGCIGREIAQTRTYYDPTVKEPVLNYKLTFPITVFDAVRQSMDDDSSITLTEMLDLIFQQIRDKQPIFPGKPANYLMTFAGVPGEVGGIKMTQEIPWDPSQQGHDRIPTEKAVGDLMFKLGLVDAEGKPINDPESKHVRWSDIIGRPMIYSELGDHEDGTMTQKAISDALKKMEGKLEEVGDLSGSKVNTFMDRLRDHMANMDNPHAVTAEQVGAVSKEELRFHIEDTINPHNITPEVIGLGNVNNTSDEDKPLSAATRSAIAKINETIESIGKGVGDLDFVTGADYDQPSGHFTLTFRSGNTVSIYIPINGLIDEITYDSETKEIVFIEISGAERRIDVSDLFIRYIGSNGVQINVIVDGDGTTGTQVIHAEIKSKSITDALMADGAVITRVLADQSVTSEKIKELTITTINIADDAITTEKIASSAVTATKLANRSVGGRALFSSQIPNRVLSVLDANTDPLWTLIYDAMIDDGAITSRTILNQAVTTDKLAIRAVTTDRLENGAVTHDKLARDAVTGDNIVENSIPGSKMSPGAMLPGTPMIASRPRASADNTQIPDTHWVRETIASSILKHENIGARAVDGTNLFSSGTRNRVLTVGRANSDPVWDQVNHDMLADGAVGTANIIDLAITPEKLKDRAIESRHISNGAIKTIHIADNAIDSMKIFPAPNPNLILASVDASGHPMYTKLNSAMIEPNAIDTMAIQDGAVTPSKVRTSPDESHMILGVALKGSNPLWMKITSQMIASRAVDGRALFSSPNSNRVLMTAQSGTDPYWGRINSDMIQELAIRQEHISNGAIRKEHLQEKIIEGRHIADWSIPGTALLPRTVTGAHLFTSDHPNRVLSVGDQYTDPKWTQVNTEMIEDQAVTKEKMMQSEHPYRVLGATQGGVPPEYLMITHQFIVDGTIIPSKLQYNFVLQGTPELTVHPAADADNYQLASTKWVRKVIRDMCIDFIPSVLANFLEISPEMLEDEWATKGTKPDEPDTDDIFVDKDSLLAGLPDGNFETIPPSSGSGNCSGCPLGGMGIFPLQSIGSEQIKDHIIDGKKLFTHPYGPRVLGITAPNEDVEFILIEEKLIVDGAVTTNKLQRDIHLLGSPVLEVRPSPTASTQYGGGELIPDCQWVLDRIAEAAKYGINGITSNNTSGFKEITPEQVKYEWQTKGLTPDEPEEEEDQPPYNGSAPSTVPIYPTAGGSGSGNCSCGTNVSDKVVENIHNKAYNETIPETDEDPLPIAHVTSNDYRKQSCNCGSGGGLGILMQDIVQTVHLQNRAVTGLKMFTSIVNNRVLGVKVANSDPEYLQVNREMVEDRAIDATKLFSSDDPYKVLIVNKAGTDPVWGLIKELMLDDNVISTRTIIDRAVTHDKLAQQAVDRENLVDKPIIGESRLDDSAVTSRKIADRAVTKSKIAKKAIQEEHIKDDIELPGHPTVAADTAYEVRSLRNIILSPNKPTSTSNNGFRNGDIWFQYI